MAKGRGGLGYRDIECFNRAMLAKQGWRLLKHPTSLVVQVMHAKYFPRGNFLDSNLGSNLLCMEEHLEGKKLIREGIIWRVGDDQSIKIWEDQWIPSPSTYMIQSPNRTLPHDARVCSLIDEDQKWWNTPLLHELFSNDEVEKICSLILCPGGQPNTLIWKGTRNGEFSVRSAYHLALDILARGRGACSSGEKSEGIWNKVWNVKGPKVVQLFLWKACYNILPTKTNLFQRQVSPNPLCPLRGRVEETTGHILWSYPSVRDVWMECSRKIQKLPCVEDGFIHIFERILEKLDEAEVQLCAVLCML